jgi:hypothetical protein
MAGRIFPFASCCSGVICFCVIGLWLWDQRRPQFGGFVQFGMGRGYHTVDFSSGAGSVAVDFTRYTEAVTLVHPNARFVYTSPYGWFVDNLRQSGFEIGRFVCGRDDCDYEMTHELFMTRWILRMPYWLVLIAASVLPAIELFVRFRRRRNALQRGFEVQIA